MKARFVLAAALWAVRGVAAEQAVNPDSAILQDFQNRVDDYMKLHKSAASKLPLKPTESQATLTAHRSALAAAIREGRAQTVQGAIFTPAIAAEFRRLIGIAMQGERAERISKSMKRAEPVHLQLKVNDSYPERVPLQSTPPTLLLSLPRLPAGLEYRVIGHDIVLRDADANLIVDFAPSVLP